MNVNELIGEYNKWYQREFNRGMMPEICHRTGMFAMNNYQARTDEVSERALELCGLICEEER